MRHPISSALCRRWPLLVIWNMNEFSWASFTCANSFSSWLIIASSYLYTVCMYTVSSSRKHRHSEWMELASWARFTRADSFGPWLFIAASSTWFGFLNLHRIQIPVRRNRMNGVSDVQIVSTNAALSKKSLQLLVLQKAEEEKHLSELERARFCLS